MTNKSNIPRFSEKFFESGEPITCLGSGEFGGKANGLVFINDLLKSKFDSEEFPNIKVNVRPT